MGGGGVVAAGAAAARGRPPTFFSSPPQVWYSVPANAGRALEAAVADALPAVWAAAPALMFQLVTAVPPTELAARGVPVHRLVHRERSFVVTFPNAYHAGFNTGFNCAEAVNFGPPNWLPAGGVAVGKYRAAAKPPTFSHDALLVALTLAARVHAREGEGEAAAAADREAGVVPRAAASDAPPTDPDAPPDRLRLSVADPPRPDEVPLQGVRLGAGELAARVDEERRRREAGAAAAGGAPAATRRMAGALGSLADDGAPDDGEDADCEVCKCDLWLAAVVSPDARGRAACPEHAAALGVPPSRQRLIYRHTLAELARYVADAERWVEGAAAAVAAARRRAAAPDLGPDPVPVGPLDQDTVLARKRAAERAAKAQAKKEKEEAKKEAAAAASAPLPPLEPAAAAGGAELA